MINLKSLRIGNYVSMTESQKYEGSELEVISINKDFVECLRLIRESDEEWTYKNDIYPIPLTEDWLIKFGFEKEKDGPITFFNKDNLAIEKYSNKCIFTDGDIYTEIYSVHHLQNIYFALVGKELKQI